MGGPSTGQHTEGSGGLHLTTVQQPRGQQPFESLYNAFFYVFSLAVTCTSCTDETCSPIQICVGRNQRSHTQHSGTLQRHQVHERTQTGSLLLLLSTAPLPATTPSPHYSRVAGSARLPRRKGGGWSVRSAALADKRGVSTVLVKFAFAFCTAV